MTGNVDSYFQRCSIRRILLLPKMIFREIIWKKINNKFLFSATNGYYPRLKNSKRTSKFQSILLYSTKNFFEKSHNAEKKLKGGTLWDFSIPSLSQNPKKMKGGPFGEFSFPKKSLAMPKKLKGGPFGLVRHCMLCGKLFGSVPWANR